VKKQFIETGKIVGTHGVCGEMRVEVWSDSPETLKALPRLYFDEGRTEMKLVSRRIHKKMLLLTLEGVDSIDEAEKLRGKRLYLNRDDVKLRDGQRFIADLVGLTAVDGETKKVYGTLTEVLETGANDVYRIVDGDGHEYLFPAAPHMIRGVDDDAGIIELLPIPGIFDDGGISDAH